MRFNRKLTPNALMPLLQTLFSACSPDPRLIEASLSIQFIKNEAALNKLVQMAHEDKDFVFIMPKNDALKGDDYRWNRE